MDRFEKTTLLIRNLSQEVVLYLMVIALRPISFTNRLCMQLVVDVDELRQRATKFMQVEERRDFLKTSKERRKIQQKEL